MRGGEQNDGRYSAAPAASTSVSARACNTAWATLPVTDIDVATINQDQKNLVAARRSRTVPRRLSASVCAVAIIGSPTDPRASAAKEFTPVEPMRVDHPRRCTF